MSQKIEVFQSLWAMELRRPDGVSWSDAQKFEMIAEAGYAGVAMDFDLHSLAEAKVLQSQFKQYNLGCVLIAFPETTNDLQGVIDIAKDFDTRYITINAKLFPSTPEEAVGQVNEWLAMGEKENIPIYLETHRYTLTTDVLFTLKLLELIPELELVADLSHIVVAREFPEPIDDLHQNLIDQILKRSATFQGRVSTRGQIQVPLGFPQHAYWEQLFKQWWEQGFRYWRAKNKKEAVLNFVCELGPPHYAITGKDGYELSDRWQEALQIKQWVEQIWQQLEAEQD